MPYTFDEYSRDVSHFAQYPMQGNNMIYPAMGVVGEAGELCDKIKKHWRNTSKPGITSPIKSMSVLSVSPEERIEIEKEIGDVLWYLNALATEIGSNLSNCALMNFAKLKDRAERNVIKSKGDNR